MRDIERRTPKLICNLHLTAAVMSISGDVFRHQRRRFKYPYKVGVTGRMKLAGANVMEILTTYNGECYFLF